MGIIRKCIDNRTCVHNLLLQISCILGAANAGQGRGCGKLLILSQVVLGLQLPFAIVPLVMFTASRSKMGEMVAPRWLTIIAAMIAAIIIALNMKLLFDLATG
jgi:manganese transport protein